MKLQEKTNKQTSTAITDLFTFFFSSFDMDKLGKIRRPWERLKISKTASFERGVCKRRKQTADADGEK